MNAILILFVFAFLIGNVFAIIMRDYAAHYYRKTGRSFGRWFFNHRVWLSSEAISFTWCRWSNNCRGSGDFRFCISFRFALFLFHFWSPFRLYTWTHWPLWLKLQSFATPRSGWLGARWRILFGPIDFVEHRQNNYLKC